MTSWKWWMRDIQQDKDISVFSCFSCGGGSTLGYKKAGFRVLGNVEIDPDMNAVYKANNHPQYNYEMDLREFNKMDLPEELYHLDILDGSPPCTTFSTSGLRDKVWGKEKVFREGQKKQTLDDLFFVFLDTVEKLKPRIVIAENVEGLILGAAKGYVNEIIKRFRELGYDVQMFLLNAATMDVPQMRKRVFFIANSQGFGKLTMDFHGEPILFGEIREPHGKPLNPESKTAERLKQMIPTDRSIKDILKRTKGHGSNFNSVIFQDHYIAATLISNGIVIRGYDKTMATENDFRNVQTFPQDYDFCGKSAQYICGMSVPPNMMYHIATEIWRQWIG